MATKRCSASLIIQFSSVAQSCPTLRPHELQHGRPPCPTPSPGVHSNSHSLSQLMPSSHLILCRPLLLLPSIFPSIRSFQMSQLFPSDGQSIGASASASVLPNGLVVAPCSSRDSQVFSNTMVQKHQFFGAQLSSQSNSHIHT